MREFPGGIYALTSETADTEQLLAQVEVALAGGVAAVQYRDKSGDVARRHEQASELVALCRRFGVPLIVNDDLRLADLCDADGVHLGRDDGSLREARITSSEPLRIDGTPGFETRIEAVTGKNDTPVTVVQWLRFGSGPMALRIIASATREEWPKAFPRFRQVRDGIQPR